MKAVLDGDAKYGIIKYAEASYDEMKKKEMVSNNRRIWEQGVCGNNMMTNTRCKELFAGEDLGNACANCRFYDETRGTDQAMCRKWKIKTIVAASCKQYEKKVNSHEA